MKKAKSHVCIDCKTTEMEDNYFGAAFMVQNHIWNTITTPVERSRLICYTCVEKRLHRTLVPEDFTQCLLNDVNDRVNNLQLKVV